MACDTKPEFAQSSLFLYLESPGSDVGKPGHRKSPRGKQSATLRCLLTLTYFDRPSYDPIMGVEKDGIPVVGERLVIRLIVSRSRLIRGIVRRKDSV